MKKAFFLLFLLPGLLLALPLQATEKPAGVLQVYLWDSYVSKTLFEKFEKETGIQVLPDVFDNNTALIDSLKNGQSYDIVSPSDYAVQILKAEKLLAPLPSGLSPERDSLAPQLRNLQYDPNRIYSIPMFYGITGLAVNADLIDRRVNSWTQYFSPPDIQKGRVGQLDEFSSVMSIAYIALGKQECDRSPETLNALKDLLDHQKPFVKSYATIGYIERLTANDVAMQMAWNGDVYNIRKENPSIRFVYPKEGVEMWIDNLAIPVTAQNPEAAEKFIRFLLRPENLSAYALETGYMPSLLDARDLLPAAMKDAPEFTFPDDLKTVTASVCPPETLAAQKKIWNLIIDAKKN